MEGEVIFEEILSNEDNFKANKHPETFYLQSFTKGPFKKCSPKKGKMTLKGKCEM